MSEVVLERSGRFWLYMGGLIAIAIATILLVIHITKTNGGTISDIPLYVYLPLIVIGIDLYRRLSFYFSHVDDKLILEEKKLTLCRNGINKVIKPSEVKKVEIKRGSGFITLVSFGGTHTDLQPWLFGKTLGKLRKRLGDFGFI